MLLYYCISTYFKNYNKVERNRSDLNNDTFIEYQLTLDSGPAYMQNDEGMRGKRLRRNSLIIDHHDLMQKLKMIEEVRNKN